MYLLLMLGVWHVASASVIISLELNPGSSKEKKVHAPSLSLTHKRPLFFYSSIHKTLPHHHHLHITTHTPLRSACNMADTEISPQVTYEELAAIEMDFEDIDNQISTFLSSLYSRPLLTVTNN